MKDCPDKNKYVTSAAVKIANPVPKTSSNPNLDVVGYDGPSIDKEQLVPALPVDKKA